MALWCGLRARREGGVSVDFPCNAAEHGRLDYPVELQELPRLPAAMFSERCLNDFFATSLCRLGHYLHQSGSGRDIANGNAGGGAFRVRNERQLHRLQH